MSARHFQRAFSSQKSPRGKIDLNITPRYSHIDVVSLSRGQRFTTAGHSPSCAAWSMVKQEPGLLTPPLFLPSLIPSLFPGYQGFTLVWAAAARSRMPCGLL